MYIFIFNQLPQKSNRISHPEKHWTPTLSRRHRSHWHPWHRRHLYSKTWFHCHSCAIAVLTQGCFVDCDCGFVHRHGFLVVNEFVRLVVGWPLSDSLPSFSSIHFECHAERKTYHSRRTRWWASWPDIEAVDAPAVWPHARLDEQGTRAYPGISDCRNLKKSKKWNLCVTRGIWTGEFVRAELEKKLISRVAVEK